MRIKAKGLHWTPVTLADGTEKTYWYARRGGPRLTGDYGSPEFIASFNAAIATKITAPKGRLSSLLQGYQQSQDFLGLRDRTRADYIGLIIKIEQKFGDAPLKALADPRTRGIFMDWRDELALRSKRQADYAWTVLARVLSWAKDRGKITVNPCERGGRVYNGTRVDFVWSEDDEAAFLEHAPTHLHLPLLLALWTGQRQGDLLRLPWSAYDGAVIRLRQSKSVRRRGRPVSVEVPVGAPLKARARCRHQAWADHPRLDRQAAMDAGRLPRLVGQGVQESGNRGRDVQRSPRHCGHALGAGRLHRSADRFHHRAQPARRALDPRRALSAPRHRTGAQRHHQAGDGLRERCGPCEKWNVRKKQYARL
jgi:integrase